MKETFQEKRRRKGLHLILLARSFDEKSPFYKENLPSPIFWEIVLRTEVLLYRLRPISFYLHYYERIDIFSILFGFYGKEMTRVAKETKPIMEEIFECLGKDKKNLSFVDEYMEQYPETKVSGPFDDLGNCDKIDRIISGVVHGDFSYILIELLGVFSLCSASFKKALERAFRKDSKKCIKLLFPYIDNYAPDKIDIGTLLYDSCRSQPENIVKVLIEKRYQSKLPIIKNGLLLRAIIGRNTRIFSILAKYGEKLDFRQFNFVYHVKFEEYIESFSTCKALYEAGLLDFEMKDFWGKTFLEVVKEKKPEELQNVLSWTLPSDHPDTITFKKIKLD